MFTTSDHGRNISKIQLDFEPSDLSFHEFKPLTFVALDKNDDQRRVSCCAHRLCKTVVHCLFIIVQLWLTEDFGKTWRVIQQYVASFFWHSPSSTSNELHLYVQRSEPTGLSSVLSSKNLFKSQSQHTVIAQEVKDFQIKGDFMFITKKSSKVSCTCVILYMQKHIYNIHICMLSIL